MEPGSQEKRSIEDAFETRISIWRSFSSARYGEEKGAGSMDADLLEHPVADSTRHTLFRDEERSLLEVERPAELASPFWVQEETIARDQESAEEASQIASATPKRHKSSVDTKDDAGVPPGSCERSRSEPRICSKVVECIGDGAEDDREAGMPEMVAHLESRVRTLDMQLETCKQALDSRERTIRELESSIEVMKSREPGRIDYELVREYARRGLEIVGELRGIEEPKDLTEENYSLRIENMSLKNIVGELAGRVRVLKEEPRD